MDDLHAPGEPSRLAYLIGRARLSRLPARAQVSLRLNLDRLHRLLDRAESARPQPNRRDLGGAQPLSRTREVA
jgi:hypothetical protein